MKVYETDFLGFSDRTEKSFRKDIIKQIEDILAIAELTHKRVRTLIKVLKQKSELKLQVLPDPLKEDDYKVIVKKGLVKAWEDQDVDWKDILKMVHSIKGLHHFTCALFDLHVLEKKNYASVWDNAFKVPFEIPHIDLDPILDMLENLIKEEFCKKRTEPIKRTLWIKFIEKLKRFFRKTD